MPITTEKNVKYLQFGYGDIFIGEIKNKNTEKTYGAAFMQTEPREIGSEWDEMKGKSLDQMDAHVIMQFDKIESLNTVIETLQDIQKAMKLQETHIST